MVQCPLFFPGWLAWYWVWPNKHGITLIPAYIPSDLNVEANYLSWDQIFPEWHLLPQLAPVAFHFWGGPADIFLFHSMPALLHLGISTTFEGLGVECLQPSLDISGKLWVAPSCISSSNSVQVSGGTCQRATQTFDSGGNMLDWGSIASHSSQYVGRHSWAVSHHKRSHHGCFGRLGAQGSAISAFNPLAAQQCVLHRQRLSSSVCQAVVGGNLSTSKVYQQCWKEWAGWCAQQGVPNNAISASKLGNILVHLFQVCLAWHTIGIHHSAISTFLEPHFLHKASNHPVISKLRHHFYLQCPPSCKCFDPWDVECLLSLLESWTSASSLTTFKLAWKTATLLALVTVKCCSDLTLLCIDNQHLFLQCHAAVFIFLSGGKTHHLGHLPPQIHIESHTSVNLCHVFYLKAYLRCTEAFRTRADGLCVTSLFLDNNKQHRPICTETISSWERKVLCIVKAHISPGSLQGAAASADLVAGVSLVSILQVGDWARISTLARHYFPLTLLLQISTRTLYSVLCWATMSRSSLGKGQTLTYIQSCVCWAVRP